MKTNFNPAQLKINISNKVNKKADMIVTESIFNLAHELVELSPVGEYHKWSKKYQSMAGEYGTDYIEGHYVMNWQFSKTKNNNELPVRGQEPKPKAEANLFELVHKEKSNFHKGGKWYLFNNTEYAMELEDGWSHQAPLGIVSLGIQTWGNCVKQAAKDNL